MSKTIFTEVQIKKLRKNKWIKKISSKSITYNDDFKYLLLNEIEDNTKTPQQVFRENGIDPEVIGLGRINGAAYRWRVQYKNTGELKDTRINKSGLSRIYELSDSEKLKRAEAKIILLEAENELLKKNEMIELGILKDIKSISNLKR